jgi:hypothetical protein
MANRRFGDELEESLKVVVLVEDRGACVAPIEDVITVSADSGP